MVGQQVFMFNESQRALLYFIELYDDLLTPFLKEHMFTTRDIHVETRYITSPKLAYHSFYCHLEEKPVSFLYLRSRKTLGFVDISGNVTCLI